MYETDENESIGILRMQNVTDNEMLDAQMYDENPTSFYPHVHIVNNPIPISSNMTESQENEPNMFHTLENARLNAIVTSHWNALSTSTNFLNNSIDGNAPNTFSNRYAPNSNGTVPSSPP